MPDLNGLDKSENLDYCLTIALALTFKIMPYNLTFNDWVYE